MNKSVSSSIEKSVKIALQLLPSKKPKLVLGVSGGPDSMALLYALYKAGAEVLVVHINYGLRGDSSDLDQELVEGMSAEWGFECCSVKLNSKSEPGNFQNWARKERYRIFNELKEINNFDCIATAHHKDDQIETILQKLLRGSSPLAWQGMRVWDGELFRPMLSFSKQEILKHCEASAIPYRVDESNLESSYARNFIRNELSEKFDLFFPGWKENILALPERGEITELSLRYILESMILDEGLELSKFSRLQKKLKAAVLKEFINTEDSTVFISKGALKDLLEIETAQPGTCFPISDDLELVRDRRAITIRQKELAVLELEISETDAKKGVTFENLEISISDDPDNKASLFIDAGLIQWPIALRRWKSGDRFIPFGMKGSQKISDHLTNRKIPSSKKEKALILSSVDSTIYAIIFPVKTEKGEMGTISDSIKCTEQTNNYLTINLK